VNCKYHTYEKEHSVPFCNIAVKLLGLFLISYDRRGGSQGWDRK